MSWTRVKEQGHAAAAKTTANEKTATRVFVAVADAATTPVAAETASDGTTTIPTVGAAHPSDSSRKVTSISAKPQDEAIRNVFIVTVEYSSGASEQSSSGDPLSDPAEISYGADGSTENYFLDESDPAKPVVNSAGDPFSDNPQRLRSTLTITVKTNEASFDPVTMSALANTTNSGSVTIDGTTYAAGTLLMGAITATKHVSGETTYYQITKPLKARHEGWEDKILDRGYNFKNTAANPNPKQKQTKPIQDAACSRATEPVPLDGSGQPADTSAENYTPTVLTFKPYKEDAWTGLKWS